MIKKQDLLGKILVADDWIKIPDFAYSEELSHLVLDPDAHKRHHYYVLMPIIESGVHGEMPPVLSSEGFLCFVDSTERVNWQALSDEERAIMIKRYPQTIDAQPLFVGMTHLRIVRPVKAEIEGCVLNPDKPKPSRRMH